MKVLLEELERSVREVPLEKVPLLLGVLATMTALSHARMLAGPALVVRDAEGLLTVREVAAQLHLSTDTVYELCRQGRIQSNNCGRSVRMKPSAVAAYLATREA